MSVWDKLPRARKLEVAWYAVRKRGDWRFYFKVLGEVAPLP